MYFFTKIGGEAPRKWLEKATMACLHSCAVVTLICVACSSCSPENDSSVDSSPDPVAAEGVEIGTHASERVEPAGGVGIVDKNTSSKN